MLPSSEIQVFRPWTDDSSPKSSGDEGVSCSSPEGACSSGSANEQSPVRKELTREQIESFYDFMIARDPDPSLWIESRRRAEEREAKFNATVKKVEEESKIFRAQMAARRAERIQMEEKKYEENKKKEEEARLEKQRGDREFAELEVKIRKLETNKRIAKAMYPHQKPERTRPQLVRPKPRLSSKPKPYLGGRTQLWEPVRGILDPRMLFDEPQEAVKPTEELTSEQVRARVAEIRRKCDLKEKPANVVPKMDFWHRDPREPSQPTRFYWTEQKKAMFERKYINPRIDQILRQSPEKYDPWAHLFPSQQPRSMRLHALEPPKKKRAKNHFCECGTSFNNKQQLTAHGRIHSGERPFACTEPGCEKRFTRNEELTRHKKIHTGLKPFKCNFCDKHFGRKDHLKKHVKTHEKRESIPTPEFFYLGPSVYYNQLQFVEPYISPGVF